MKSILMIENPEANPVLEGIIKDYVGRQDLSITYTKRNDVFDEKYMLTVTGLIKEQSIDCIISIGYLEPYSLLCGVLGLKYFCWIIDDGKGAAYFYSVKNNWNRIFTANSVVLARLTDCGLENVSFLPLCFLSDLKSVDETPTSKDIILWDEGGREYLSVDPIMNGLKDSSKGYVDAILEARRADLRLGSVTELLPDYVLDDVKSNVAYNESSFLDFFDFCDRTMLFPALDRAVSFVYYHALLCNRVVKEIYFATNGDLPFTNPELVKVDRSEAIKDNYEPLKQFKVVAYFNRFSDDGMITQDLWNMMAKGLFVLCSANTDLSVLGEDAPDTFKNTWEFESKVRYYLENETAREERTDRVRRKVLSLGTYDDRLKVLFGEK